MHCCGASHLGPGLFASPCGAHKAYYSIDLHFYTCARLRGRKSARARICAAVRPSRHLAAQSGHCSTRQMHQRRRPRSSGWPAPAELTLPECPRAQGPRFVSGGAVPRCACPACNACGHSIAATQKSRRSAQTPRRPVCGYCLPGRALSPPSGWPPAPTCAWHGWRVCSPTAPTPVSRPATSSAPARA